ncbi:hypothetical protein JAAARDRAFT_36476 [Jaapia argillacea MUCL 33604]|uniref:Ketoreductase domain-containing protein n=1 Tax=Jaapia argillacea MUCL 33604 TaxID=933084 RepID=A0A067PYE5_9AGAM|nr:hypothetical protein JAAARDRAFT_36476 [Jaapia argillacea MUCL 33604]
MSQIASVARVAIVTGSAQGIGRAIALQLAEDGPDVVVNDIKSCYDKVEEVVNQIRAKGGKAVGAVGDVSSEVEVQAVVDKAVSEFGGLDVMVANAGVLAIKPFLDTSVKDWERILSINSRGTFLLYQAAARQMIKQGRGGSIIAACSDAGTRGMPMLSAYSASKAAVRGLTQTASTELWRHGITVNAYAPGAIATDMALHAIAEGGAEEKVANDTAETVGLPSDTPVGTPEDVAALVSFLASPKARWISGQTIHVNGGAQFE